MDPKSHDKCPYNIYPEERDGQRGGDMKTEVEIVMIWLQSKECQGLLGSHQKLEEAENEFSSRVSKGNVVLLTR